MTYQTPSTPKHDDDDVQVEEATALLSDQGGGGGGGPARKKKHGVPTLRALIVGSCFVLGTLAVMIYGGRGGSSSTTHRTAGSTADLLRGYDPSQDFCFQDNDNNDKLCWYPTDNFPCGDWKGVSGLGSDQCGPPCTQVYKMIKKDDGSKFKGCVPPLYNPSLDFCFRDNDNANKYCWYNYDNLPCGNWKGEGGHDFNNCGPPCTNVYISGGCHSVEVLSS